MIMQPPYNPSAIDPDHLAVFMEGTANTLQQPITTQIGDFFHLVAAKDVSAPELFEAASMTNDLDGPVHWKMGFDGCGVTDGLAGTIWAWGLGTQCSAVVKRVEWLLEQRKPRPLRVDGRIRPILLQLPLFLLLLGELRLPDNLVLHVVDLDGLAVLAIDRIGPRYG